MGLYGKLTILATSLVFQNICDVRTAYKRQIMKYLWEKKKKKSEQLAANNPFVNKTWRRLKKDTLIKKKKKEKEIVGFFAREKTLLTNQ